MRLQGDRVHSPESLTAWERLCRCRRHIGKLSPAAVRNSRITGPSCYRHCVFVSLQYLLCAWLVMKPQPRSAHNHHWSCFYYCRLLHFHVLSFLLPHFWRAYYHQQAFHCLCTAVTNVRQQPAPRLPGRGGRERRELASVWGKQKLQMLNCDPPPEENAFLEKPDGKILKAASVKTWPRSWASEG